MTKGEPFRPLLRFPHQRPNKLKKCAHFSLHEMGGRVVDVEEPD
jgi:hypothetical protein